MHEYILYSQIPAARESQVLKLLAGVTATQPVPICEQTLIYAQQKLPEVSSTKKTKQPQQRKDPSYHKLVRDISLDNGAPEAGPWRLRMEETPEPGVQNMLSRGVVERPAEKTDLDRLKSPEWYQFKQQYTQIGNRFIQGNVIIRVVRFYMPTQPTMVDPIDAAPHSVNDLKLLDQSGSCVVEAIVRVETLSNSTITDKAKQELSAFHSYMDGAITLYAPDRLALDTRVKGKA